MCILILCCIVIVSFVFRTVLFVLLCCSVCCFVLMYTVLLPTGDNPIAGNKYIYLSDVP